MGRIALRLSFVALIAAASALGPARAAAEAGRAVDALGRAVSFERTPQRILVVGRATLLLADAVYLFPGARGRVVGIGETDQGLGDSMTMIDRDYHGKTRFANSVGPEELATAKPDLVILKTSMKSRLGDALERMGFPVFYLDLESPDSFRRDIRSLGDLFGEADRAAEVVRWYDQRVEAVARQAAGVARPRVLLLQSAGSGAGASCSIPPASWIQSWMTAAAGGDPVWLEWNGGGGWLKVSLEQAAAWRPEVVLVVSYQEPAAAAADRLRSLGLFAAKVLPFPSDFMSWDQADARWILGLQWMAAALHPDRASGFDLEAEVTRFYGDLYGVDASTVRSTVVPLLSRSLGTR